MKRILPATRSESTGSQLKTTRLCERPLRICVVFDENESAVSAEDLITRVVSDYKCARQSLRFDELEGPKAGVAAARRFADADILLLAARGDQTLPSYIRLWLGLCLGLRDERQQGALVVLITKVAGTLGLHSSIVEYLETIAIIGGVVFFPQTHRSPAPLPQLQYRSSAATAT